ncbi:hypothetical protein N7510_004012, partial [Penicillium lagena]|uniref:uncharacterized protein n=1 Tax=Penicillium lagena TaxID=94218 RepID=UPI0025415633
GGIAPTIGLAIYQSESVANHFSTIGYLIPIMSILTIPIAPRARFFQTLLVTMKISTGFAIGISYLSMWCSVRARANTTHIQEAKGGGPVSGATVSPFNAASSANMAIWFFFEVWMANTLVCRYPNCLLSN